MSILVDHLWFDSFFMLCLLKYVFISYCWLFSAIHVLRGFNAALIYININVSLNVEGCICAQFGSGVQTQGSRTKEANICILYYKYFYIMGFI